MVLVAGAGVELEIPGTGRDVGARLPERLAPCRAPPARPAGRDRGRSSRAISPEVFPARPAPDGPSLRRRPHARRRRRHRRPPRRPARMAAKAAPVDGSRTSNCLTVSAGRQRPPTRIVSARAMATRFPLFRNLSPHHSNRLEFPTLPGCVFHSGTTRPEGSLQTAKSQTIVNLPALDHLRFPPPGIRPSRSEGP